MKEFNIKVGLFLPGLMNTSFQNDRKHEIKAPVFLILNPQKAAKKLEEMIYRRRKKVYMYRGMLLFMKAKQLIGQLLPMTYPGQSLLSGKGKVASPDTVLLTTKDVFY
jgi:short-subunit dehydrogenase